MTNTKRKSFQFEEKDLEWINPLILEWTEENEGKKQSEFIVELLKEYKSKREDKSEEGKTKVKEEKPLKKDKTDYFTRVREVQDDFMDKIETNSQKLLEQMRKGYKELDGNVRKLDLNKKLKSVSQKTVSQSKDLYSKTQEQTSQVIKKIKDKIKKD